MKKFILILVSILFCSSLFAEDIPLSKKDAGAGGYGMGNDKELVVGVSASIEDVVSIYDSSCVVVYTSVSEIEGKTHEFVVGEQPSGDYILEVEIGDTLASGEFTID